jgi:hypothetical protein
MAVSRRSEKRLMGFGYVEKAQNPGMKVVLLQINFIGILRRR